MNLQQKVEEILQGTSATFGISIKHTLTNEEVNINEDQLFQMASVFKVPILMTLYEKVFNGEIDLNKRIEITAKDRVPGSGVIQEMDYGVEVTIKDLATMMIIVSDNLATDKLYHMLGKEAIAETLYSLGLESISVNHSCWELLSFAVGMEPQPYSESVFEEMNRRLFSDEEEYTDDIVLQADKENNLCSPKDMTNLLEKLNNKEFINASCSDAVLDIMLRQQLGQRIPGRLPSGTKVAHKTGSITSALNDAGIVYLPNDKGEYIISVFSFGNTLNYEGIDVIARISQTAYEHFLHQ